MSINLTDELQAKTKKGKIASAKQVFLEGDTQTVEKEIQDINSRHNDLSSKHESLSSTVSEHTNQIESNQSQITANKSAQDAKNASLDANMAKLNTRDDQITELVRGITATGGASVATAVTYDNTSSHLASATVQGAVDELQGSKANNEDISIKKEKSTSVSSLIKLFDFNQRNNVYFNDEPITGIVNSIEAYVDSASTNYIYKISKTTNKAIYICSISGNSDAGWVKKDVDNIKFNDEYIGIAAVKIPYSEQSENVAGKTATATSDNTMLSEGDKDISQEFKVSTYSFGIKANYTAIEKIDFTSTFNELNAIQKQQDSRIDELKTEVAEKANNEDISIKKVKSTSVSSLIKLFDFNQRKKVYFNDEPITGIVNSIEAYVDSASTNYIYKISKTTNKAIYICSISGNSDAGWVKKDVDNIKFNDEYIGIAAVKIPYSEQSENVAGKTATATSDNTMLSEGDKDILVDSSNSKYSFGIKANYTAIEKIDFTSTFNELNAIQKQQSSSIEELKTEVAEKANLIKKWKNKKYLAIGDSITFGVGTTMPYPKIVADTLGMTLNNVAHSGDPLHYALAIWDNLDNYDYDLITISLGTNNFVPTVSGCDGIGDSWFIKEEGNNIFYTSDSKNIYATNFKVAFNNLCSRVLEHCPTAKILFLTPIHRLNEYTENDKGKILKDYVDTIKEGCELWGIECVDMYELININPNIHSKLTTYFAESQQNMGLHPNKLAHDLMAEVLFKKL